MSSGGTKGDRKVGTKRNRSPSAAEQEPLTKQSRPDIGVPSVSGQDSKRRTRSSTSPANVLSLCVYCGDEFSGKNQAVNKNRKIHRSCLETHEPRCKKAVEDFKSKFTGECPILRMSLNVYYVNGQTTEPDKKRKREKRAIKQEELVRKVSALRNSSGGFIVIHIVGLTKNDNYNGHFHDFADGKLKNLIHGGHLFHNVYKLQRMSESNEKDLKNYTDFLVLYVAGADYLTTAEFHTKLSSDSGIWDLNREEVLTFLKDKKQFGDNFPLGLSDSHEATLLQENRAVQVKADCPDSKPPKDLVSHVLKCRLTEYASAFTKQEEGGIFIYGVREKGINVGPKGQEYKSVKLEVECVPVSKGEYFRDELKRKLVNSILVCDYEGEILNTDFIKVDLLPSCGNRMNCTMRNSSSNEHFIIQVAFKPVNGIVFHDRRGPLAYYVAEQDTQCYTLSDWFRIFKERHICYQSSGEVDQAHN